MSRWPIVPLGEVCAQDRRTVRVDHSNALALPFLGLEQVASGSGDIDLGEGSRTGDDKSTCFSFDSRHVLYGKLRPYLNKVGLPEFAGRCSTELVPLLPKPGVDRAFVALLLRRKQTVEAVMAANTGARMPRADMRVLMSLLVPVPPYSEQRRIVDILNRANGIRCLRREARDKARQLMPAMFINMFGDPGGSSHGWPRKRLGDLGVLDRGRSRHRPRNDPRLLGGPYPFIQTGDVANSGGMIDHCSGYYSEFGLEQSKLWPKGTLCISIAANIGHTGILGFDACFPDSVVGFTPGDDVTVDYVQQAMTFFQFGLERMAPQLAQKNINLHILRDLELPVPPLRLQHEFVGQVADIRAMIAQQDRMAEAAEALMKSLMARLFDGAVVA